MFGLKNERTVIQFDNEKGRKMDFLRRLFIAAIIAVAALTFYLPGKYLMSQAQSTRLNSTLFGLILGCGGLMRHYIKVMEKENAGLVLSSQGIVFNGTELGRGLGLVAWEDIEAVDRGDGDCVYLRLKNPEKYSGREGGEERILKEGVEIRAEGLRTGFKGMEGNIRRYFERAGGKAERRFLSGNDDALSNTVNNIGNGIGKAAEGIYKTVKNILRDDQ